ncbi:MAG: ABC transporter ATP-binding protein [Bacteroidales bacterium]|nr:ABC transporter ATP-binding protein [Bacteroidales bacterium]
MNYLETIDVVKQYANHRALDGVSISVPENKIYGLLGPNGAGKTTMIRIINQITAPDSGKVLLNGEPLKPEDIHRIGYLPEERGLYKKMKVGEQVLYLGQLKGLSKSQAKEKIQYWFERFGIADWKDKKIEELSKGMQQKVQFITTILHDPKLLIFDEPFSGFDPVNAELMKKEILNLKENGATIILSTHNMSSVEELCEEITLINRSKAVLQGKVAQIRQDYKKHIFKVQVEGNNFNADPEVYSLLESKQIEHGTEAIIKIENTLSNNDVVRKLMETYNLIMFEEILPSMQEVFIETVKETTYNE